MGLLDAGEPPPPPPPPKALVISRSLGGVKNSVCLLARALAPAAGGPALLSSAWSLRASSASASTSTVGGGGGGGGGGAAAAGAAREARVERPPPPPLPPREEDISAFFFLCAWFSTLSLSYCSLSGILMSCWGERLGGSVGRGRRRGDGGRSENKEEKERKVASKRFPPRWFAAVVVGVSNLLLLNRKKRARAPFCLRCLVLQPRAGPRTSSRLLKGRKGRARAQRDEALAKTERGSQRGVVHFLQKRPSWPRRSKKKKAQIRLRAWLQGSYASFWTLCRIEEVIEKPSGTRNRGDWKALGSKKSAKRMPKAPPTASRRKSSGLAAEEGRNLRLRSSLSCRRALERSPAAMTAALSSPCHHRRTVGKGRKQTGKASKKHLRFFSFSFFVCFSPL